MPIRFMDSSRALAAMAATVALAASCGGNPAGPDSKQSLPELRIVADPVVTMTRGEATTLSLEERDAAGRIVTQPASTYTWSSSDPAIVRTTEAGVLTAGPGLGQVLVTARSSAGLTATARVWVQRPPGEPSTFRITLVYKDNVPAAWRALYDDAARRWERVIRAPLPPATIGDVSRICGAGIGHPSLAGTERGTRIHIGVDDAFRPGSMVEAVGGPCSQRPLPYPTTIYGRISLNARVPFDAIPEARRKYLALHEMGHVFGLVGVFIGQSPEWFKLDANFENGTYTGPMALEGYRRRFGSPLTSMTIRSGSHWPYNGDVMGNVNLRISDLSIGALMDIGYPAAWYGAH